MTESENEVQRDRSDVAVVLSVKGGATVAPPSRDDAAFGKFAFGDPPTDGQSHLFSFRFG